jgi:hypothetical protein
VRELFIHCLAVTALLVLLLGSLYGLAASLGG